MLWIPLTAAISGWPQGIMLGYVPMVTNWQLMEETERVTATTHDASTITTVVDRGFQLCHSHSHAWLSMEYKKDLIRMGWRRCIWGRLCGWSLGITKRDNRLSQDILNSQCIWRIRGFRLVPGPHKGANSMSTTITMQIMYISILIYEAAGTSWDFQVKMKTMHKARILSSLHLTCCNMAFIRVPPAWAIVAEWIHELQVEASAWMQYPVFQISYSIKIT